MDTNSTTETHSRAHKLVHGKLKVVMLDDHRQLVEVHSQLFEKHCDYLKMDFEFFGCTTIEQAENIIREQSPTVMILDKDLGPSEVPGEQINGIDHIAHFLQICPFMNIVVLTSSGAVKDVEKALILGASGFLPKQRSANFSCLFEYVRKAHDSAEDKRKASIARRVEQGMVVRSATDQKLIPLEVAEFPGTSESARRVQTNLKVLSENHTFSVYFHGPFGAGKGLAARVLNKLTFGGGSDSQQETDLFSVNLNLKKGTEALEEVFGVEKDDGSGVILKKGLLDLVRSGSFVFENISCADSEMQLRVIELIEKRRFKRINGDVYNELANKRIVFTDINAPDTLSSKSDLSSEFVYSLFNAMSVSIPSLKDRACDVREALKMLVPRVCAKLGIKFEYEDLPNTLVIHFTNRPPENGVSGLEQALVKLFSYAPKGKDGRPVLSAWRKYLDYGHVPKNLKSKATGGSFQARGALSLEFIKKAESDFFKNEECEFPGLAEAKQALEDRIIGEAYEKYTSIGRMAKAMKVTKPTAWRKLEEFKKRKGISEKR